MKRARLLIILAGIAVWTLSISCDEDGDDSKPIEQDSDTEIDKDTGPPSDVKCDTKNAVPIATACKKNDDCNKEDSHANYCHTFWTSPPDPNAECRPGVQNKIQITGNLRDFETEELIPGAELKLASAGETLHDVTAAKTLATVTTDENGLFDYEGGSDVNHADLGLVAHLSDFGDYYLTVTGLVQPEIGGVLYPPGIRNHDVWAVSKTFRNKITQVMIDSGLEALTPFGEKGGVIGKIRDADTGKVPEIPVRLQSRLKEVSEAKVFYLSADGTKFEEGYSTCSGIFLILQASTSEKFDAYRGSDVVSNHEATVGTAFGAAYATSIQVDDDGA